MSREVSLTNFVRRQWRSRRVLSLFGWEWLGAHLAAQQARHGVADACSNSSGRTRISENDEATGDFTHFRDVVAASISAIDSTSLKAREIQGWIPRATEEEGVFEIEAAI